MNISGIDQSWLKSYLASANGSSSTSSASSTSSTKKNTGVSQSDFAKIIMAQLDTDGDGQISAEELQAGTAKLKNSLSSLNDISSQMRSCNAKGNSSATASTLISELDSNGDSNIDITEAGLSQADFSKIDIDGNGKLSADELTALADKANGSSSSTKIKATQSDCINILNQLQAKGAVRQYQASQSTAQAA